LSRLGFFGGQSGGELTPSSLQNLEEIGLGDPPHTPDPNGWKGAPRDPAPDRTEMHVQVLSDLSRAEISSFALGHCDESAARA
jgi:hypothetical protein